MGIDYLSQMRNDRHYEISAALTRRFPLGRRRRRGRGIRGIRLLRWSWCSTFPVKGGWCRTVLFFNRGGCGVGVVHWRRRVISSTDKRSHNGHKKKDVGYFLKGEKLTREKTKKRSTYKYTNTDGTNWGGGVHSSIVSLGRLTIDYASPSRRSSTRFFPAYYQREGGGVVLPGNCHA